MDNTFNVNDQNLDSQDIYYRWHECLNRNTCVIFYCMKKAKKGRVKTMNKLAESMKKESNETTTMNGAYALKSTGSNLLDLFSRIGSMRNVGAGEIALDFDSAYREDSLLATKLMFYARDIREGLGERRAFRIILKDMAERHPEVVIKNMELIGFYGRYDDLYELVGTKVEKQMWQYMRKQLYDDYTNMKAGKPVSLLAKWIKLPDSKSKATSAMGSKTMNGMGFRNNRIEGIKMVKELRKYLEIPEIAIAAKDYASINYSKIASQCMRHYKEAFKKHDAERFEEFIGKVNSGEVKMNAGAITPVEILKQVISCDSWNMQINRKNENVAEAQWKSLPNFAGDKNALVMADTSGSMTSNGGAPIITSIALAMYFAEKNTGAFHNMFMTFSSNPEYIHINENDGLCAKIKKVSEANWGNNTDFQRAYKKILNTAVAHHVPVEDMPEAIIVVSDMQFDVASHDNDKSYVKLWKEEFEKYGYNVPRLVFWNVNGSMKNTQANKDDPGITLVSGSSATQFKNVIEAINTTPMEHMMNVLNSDRYSAVTV